MDMTKSSLPLLPLFMTALLDLLGLGIIIPVLAPIFLDPAHSIFSVDSSLAERTLLLGFLISAYPLAQFFGAPVLGGLSDRHGRKKILLLALSGTLFGYILFALGVIYNNIALLFASRLLDGFTGGNIAIVQSAIADVSDAKSRSSNFGLIGIALALGFIIGPYIGGKLADPTLVSWFDYATPFWFAAALAALNILLVIWRFPETLRERSSEKIHPLSGFTNLKKAFLQEDARIMFLVIFLLTFGFNFFAQFFQVYLVSKFHFTQSAIGDLFAYTGVWLVITQGVLIRPLEARYSPTAILRASSLLLAICLPLLLLPNSAPALYAIIPLIAIFQGLTVPTSTTIISQTASTASQGEMLGINQSIQSLGQAIPPIIAGTIVSLHMNAPIVVAALVTLAAWYIFTYFFAGASQSGS
jgi:DHA1 family tetracycline resistance protein-like MFS transporter